MKITKEFAQRLAKKIVTRAAKSEQAAIDALYKKVTPKVMRHLYKGKRKTLEAIGAPWISMCKKGDTFHLTFKNGTEDGGTINIKLLEDCPLPTTSWNGIKLDFADDLDTFEELLDLRARCIKVENMGWQMKNELYQNILAAKTDKALLLAWPDAAADINATIVEMGGPPAGVEVPLSTIVSRYLTPALAAPAEAEILENAA